MPEPWEQAAPVTEGAAQDELQAPITEEDPRHPNHFNQELFLQEQARLQQEEQQRAAAYEAPVLDAEGEVAAEEVDPGFIADNPGQAIGEVAAALVGGGADAIESVGSVADLTGDTLKTAWGSVFGNPVEDSENPFHADYQSGTWLDIPDNWVPENKTGLGKIARGLVEFGLLTAATGGVGSTAAKAVGIGGLKLGTRALATARGAGVGTKGYKYINFITKAPRVATEGAVAELISNQSEEANIANLINEHAPWIPFSEILSVNPDDNPWLARTKSVIAGSGMNMVFWGINSYARGKWKAKQVKKNGGTDLEANDAGNLEYQTSLEKSFQEGEAANMETAAHRFSEGYGISHADPRDEFIREHLTEAEYKDFSSKGTHSDVAMDLEQLAETRGAQAGATWDWQLGRSTRQFEEFRKSDAFVNPKNHIDAEKANPTVGPDAPMTWVRTSLEDIKTGGTGRGWKNVWTSHGLKMMSRNGKARTEFLDKTRDELVNKIFRSPDNTLSQKEIGILVDDLTNRYAEILVNGGDLAKGFKDALLNDPKNYRLWADAGGTIKTISPSQKVGVQLTIAMLNDTVEAISAGALMLGDNIPIGRQYEMAMDALKVLMIEQKRYSVMWGLDGVAQQHGKLPGRIRAAAQEKLQKIDVEMDEYFSELDKLRKNGDYRQMKGLMEINALSGQNVRTLEQMHDYYWASMKGGEVNGLQIRGKLGQQALGYFYNSILSSITTPIKAIFGTNMIATLRPFQAWIGATLTGDATEKLVAASMIDSLGKAYKEGFDMFMYNWKLGLNRKTQTYDIRYQVAEDIQQWEALGDNIQQFGTAAEKRAYGALNASVGFNTNPWVKYSSNAMGAGDALARTVIGRMEMRHRAIRKALQDPTVDPNDAIAIARATEDNFRRSIFKEGPDGKWVVHDGAAKLAGDEAAMTKALEGHVKGLEAFANIPIMKPFMPFVKTGVNALDLSFQHTPLAMTQRKFKDIMNGTNLDKYGIRPEDLAQQQALVKGRIAMGTTLGTAFGLAALQGKVTGDYPYDRERRDLWIANQIPPYSLRIGNSWVSYRHLEPFNTILAFSANLAQNADVLGEATVDEGMRKTKFMISAVLVDKTMLAGLKDFFAVFSDEDKGTYQLENFMARQSRALLPWSGLLTDIADITDAVRRETSTVAEKIQSRTLFKASLPPKYDILSKDRSGKEFTGNAEFDDLGSNLMLRIFNTISPIPVVPVAEDDLVKKTLLDMRYDLPGVMRSYKGVPLNSLQRSRLQYYLSTGKLRKRLERLINPKNSRIRKGLALYKKGLPDGTKFREVEGWKIANEEWYQDVHAVFSDAIDDAMIQVMQEDALLRRQVDLMDRKKRLARSGYYGSRREHIQRLTEPGGFYK